MILYSPVCLVSILEGSISMIFMTSYLDKFSTYYLVSCRDCSTALGRMYKTTSPELDSWRGNYTFSSETLSFYELSDFVPISVMDPVASGATLNVENGVSESVNSKGKSLEIAKVIIHHWKIIMTDSI